MIKDKLPTKIQDLPSQAQEAKITKPEKNPEVEKVAKMMEQEFLREMLGAMRKSISKSDLVEESMAQKIYEDKTYEHYLDEWTKAGGVGMSEIIYQQLMERYYPQKIQKAPRGQAMPYKESKSFEVTPEQASGSKFNKKI